ncbi:MAG: glycosyltransferase family 4 protein, partial [Patescibacteria group bacterium]
MKVLIISLAYLPFVGGAELAVKEITDRISDISAKGGSASGWDFDLVTVNLSGREKEVEKIGNVKIHRIGQGKLAKYSFPLAGFKKAAELHRQNKYDVIWAVMANQAGLAALKFKKQFPEVKYLLTLQEGDSLKRIWSRTWFMRRAYKQIYRQADCIQSISTFLADRAKKYGFEGKLEIVPNGVDLT